MDGWMVFRTDFILTFTNRLHPHNRLSVYLCLVRLSVMTNDQAGFDAFCACSFLPVILQVLFSRGTPRKPIVGDRKFMNYRTRPDACSCDEFVDVRRERFSENIFIIIRRLIDCRLSEFT